MTGQDEPKGGISNFSIGLGSGTPRAEPVSPAPPFRVLIAGDFGMNDRPELLNITGLDSAELLEAHRPQFTARAKNCLGSHPAELEERISFSTLKDLRPPEVVRSFQFVRQVDEAQADRGKLSSHGQLYDKLVEALRPEPLEDLQAAREESPSEASDGLDALFSMINTPGNTEKADDPGSRAKSAVDAFVQRTLREERRKTEKPEPPTENAQVQALVDAQARLFLESTRLRTVLQNWHGLNLLLSEVSFSLPMELHLLQLDDDLDRESLYGLLGGPSGALQADLFDVVLFANPVGIAGQEADALKLVARECADSDTVGLIALEAGFAGVPGERLASMEAAHQLLEEPGFEGFRGLRETDAATHLALFWNEARLSVEEEACPAVYASAVWIALAGVLTGLEKEIFPCLPVGVPSDFDALEVAESLSMGRAVATACRFLAGPGAAPSLAQYGINVLEGVANRTSLVFRRAVTLKPGKEGRGSLDQALLVSRLFSLFQEALGGAIVSGQAADVREAAVRENLDRLSTSLGGEVSFQVQRTVVDDQDLIGVTASVLGGWATGQTHSFYLPAADS
ncbi:type VI secretion system contractile sheath small subunit [Roseibium marinum]|uniref:TssC1 N-terminal domain-containing protein n=1 Tax=Roseibium marinum TaxID=281252 RepID=A0A2S3V1J5_9HYPH|nr:hypothetical protein [Roseibium marinum]POF33785.1 hypothetical protein CLV41_101234 [Roseibium marinum]